MPVKRKAVGRVWSTQQKTIFTRFAKGNPKKSFVVRARAGTGKTTTILEGVGRAPERRKLVCAFNNRIAKELRTRNTDKDVDVKTLHATGYAIVRANARVVLVEGNARKDAATRAVAGTAPPAVQKQISKLHTHAREALPHATAPGSLLDLMADLEIEPNEYYAQQGFGVEFVEEKALAAMAWCATNYAEIDFADMIFLPVRNHWLAKTYDLVVVDEAQDMTLSQLEIAEGICAGRLVVVGDDRQAIYGFRGADSGSLDRLKEKLAADEYGLTVTYRCGRAIVDEAKKLVPDFEAGPQNAQGEVLYQSADTLLDKVTPGDFVLSRTNAPLADLAMMLIRRDVRCRIAGRDLGTGLINLIMRLSGDGVAPIDVAMQALLAWERQEVERLIQADREHKVEAVHDKAETLITLMQDATTIAQVTGRIQALFSDLDDTNAVTLSSVHRAKGLEAKRVFVLNDTLRHDDIEEQNIHYVAITRAIETLVYVTGKVTRPERKPAPAPSLE